MNISETYSFCPMLSSLKFLFFVGFPVLTDFNNGHTNQRFSYNGTRVGFYYLCITEIFLPIKTRGPVCMYIIP